MLTGRVVAPQLSPGEASVEAMLKDARLDDEIATALQRYRKPVAWNGKGGSVLLTGATGFIGAHVVVALLEHTGVDEIVCLVRGEGKGSSERTVPVGGDVKTAQRLLECLERHGALPLIEPVLGKRRLVAIQGDLSKVRLGLADSQWSMLAAETSAIVHCGAHVSHLLPYSALRASNVVGTAEVLRLAARIGSSIPSVSPATVHFVSSISVLNAEDGQTSETAVLHGRDLAGAGGYSQSKWVSEQLAKAAGECGLPMSISRPGSVSGHSVTGALNPGDVVNRLLGACLLSGLAPDSDAMIELVPVDYVARAVVTLLAMGSGRIAHLVSPARRLSEIVDMLAQLRPGGIQRKEFGEWRDVMAAAAEEADDAGLRVAAGLLGPVLHEFTDCVPSSVEMGSTEAKRHLPFDAAKIDERLIGVYAARLRSMMV